MTRVEFIFNVESKLAKTVDLCEKALMKGHQLTIVAGDVALFDALQMHCWQYSPTSFLPIHFLDAASDTLAFSKDCSIHFLLQNFSLQNNAAQSVPLLQDDILVNFQPHTPPFFSRFRHLIELVSGDEQDKIAARTRYKFYRDRGYEIKNTNLADN